MEDIFEAEEDRGRGLEASDWDGPSDPVPQRKAQPTLMAQLVELQEENARLREDAERYRWLKANCTQAEQMALDRAGWPAFVNISFCREGTENIDAAIDAARKEQ